MLLYHTTHTQTSSILIIPRNFSLLVIAHLALRAPTQPPLRSVLGPGPATVDRHKNNIIQRRYYRKHILGVDETDRKYSI